ncbi:MAG: HAMP domain-containing histidine kinase [Lachnospiraceae bacterium]|nr:HAMP domain-containing histidine kinase [Lachnospiraceae bacterium]
MKKKFSSLNMTILKIFISIVLISTIVAMLLFIISFLGVGTIMSNGGDVFPNNPRGILQKVSENFLVTGNDAGEPAAFVLPDETIVPEEDWCILLNENGDIVWSLHKPADIPDHYSLNDIARITRWFLSDYPVYVRTEDYGLFILGLPKNAVGKYSLEYTMEWYDTLPTRILCVFILNFIAAFLLSSMMGSFLYKKIRLLTDGLVKLRKEEVVALPSKGIFKEPFANINQTSQTLARKNALLSKRDKARSNWISGISHDIRTPLSMVIGYGEQLAENTELSEENQKYAAIITAQGLKIKKLVEDLNLISSLEYEMQPHNKKPLHISVLLRSVVSELLNSDLINIRLSEYSIEEYNSLSLPDQKSSERYTLFLSLSCEQAVILGDESLLTRAFYNLLQNSIAHNKNGCRIFVSGSLQDDCVTVVIADDGQGVPEKVLENLDTLPNTAHGFGLPMACKIIRAHGGTFRAENKDGFVVTIRLPFITP